MANGHGGYRQPSNPAPVSGPGALSARTDGGVPRPQVGGLAYGDNGAANANAAAAPLAQAAGTPAPSGAPARFTPPVSLGDPSTMPGQPVTAGADAGAGPSSADIGLSQGDNHEIRQKLGPVLPVLMRMADSPYATSAYKRQVRQLIARITT